MAKKKAAVLGATGMVGQRFINLLEDHPWFELKALMASERSSGKRYCEAAKWVLDQDMSDEVGDMEVLPMDPKAAGDLEMAFSALPSDVAKDVEESFAKAGITVLSNARAHRMEPDVPLLNPEVNSDHVKLIDAQRKNRGWDGAIITNPNCSVAVLSLSLKPIYETFGLKRVLVSTMQALSGAGFPGVAAIQIVDNVIPYIESEEEKVQDEALKILGQPKKPASFKISASCNRVQVIDGHTEAVFVETEKKAEPEEVVEALEKFTAEPQKLKLPSAPEKPIVVKRDNFRPQPRLDRMEGRGMAVVVGRVRRDPALDGIKYIVLGHNTLRGAAGCSILNAELLEAKGYL
jgi:aspartate-semialdehyde dehydrogenase